MSRLETLSGLEGFAVPGRYGQDAGAAGVVASERRNLGLATVAARKGQEAALDAAVRSAYGTALPSGPVTASGKDVRFLGMAPGQWLAVSDVHPNEALASLLAKDLKGRASVADQSSGRVVLRLEGASVRDVLAKGLAIDLDPREFGDGAVATTSLAHIGLQMWRDGEAYDIALFRSFGGSFWEWLSASAAEFGLDYVTRS